MEFVYFSSILVIKDVTRKKFQKVVYKDVPTRYSDVDYLKERAILTPTNQVAENYKRARSIFSAYHSKLNRLIRKLKLQLLKSQRTFLLNRLKPRGYRYVILMWSLRWKLANLRGAATGVKTVFIKRTKVVANPSIEELTQRLRYIGMKSEQRVKTT
ncbi:hypothetical protein TRIUR3_28256 [Triticum urartu]|uniref:Uncharacterized protein n=1 Tax=Triticum urartu TaxID=4572 RepID=M7YER0_TRIUA|nr:hypothetical protein TRIUR3_28256 [Triticum urartu]